MTDVAVVGGGLAGLVAASRLAEAGSRVRLFEERDVVGGRVASVHEDGFTFDDGFQVLFTAYPAAREELDLDALSLRRFAPGATIARPNHRSTLSDPLRDPGAALPTLFNRDVTLGDKLRVLRLQRDLARRTEREVFAGEDTSIRAFLADYGFSDRFVENFVEPFYGGITLDRSLSSSASVFRYTFKMLSEGDTAVPADGMGAIPEQLAARARAADARLETGTRVEGLEGTALDLGGETVEVDAVVVATDPRAAERLADVDTPEGAHGCVTQYVSIATHDALDTGKRILLNSADDRPNTVAPMSAVAPEYAPADRELLSATFLGRQTTRRCSRRCAGRSRRGTPSTGSTTPNSSTPIEWSSRSSPSPRGSATTCRRCASPRATSTSRGISPSGPRYRGRSTPVGPPRRP